MAFFITMTCDPDQTSHVAYTVNPQAHAHSRTLRSLLVLVAVALGGACNRGGVRASAGPAAPPPMGVGTIVLQNKPIQQSSDFIATVRSLRSSTVQPDVEGVVTHIFVKSGDRVAAGAADRRRSSPTSSRRRCSSARGQPRGPRGRRAVLARTGEAARGARGGRCDQPPGVRAGAEPAAHGGGRLDSLNAQVQRTAGGAAVLPRRTRRRRASSATSRFAKAIASRNPTVITTIDDNDSLEVYVQIPLDRAPDLRVGLPVQLLDADGQDHGDQSDHVRRAARRRRDADGARQERAPRSAAIGAYPAVHSSADRLAVGARTHDPDHRRHPHQREVLLLRRRDLADRGLSRASARSTSAT